MQDLIKNYFFLLCDRLISSMGHANLNCQITGNLETLYTKRAHIWLFFHSVGVQEETAFYKSYVIDLSTYFPTMLKIVSF